MALGFVGGDLSSLFGGSSSKPFLDLTKNFGALFNQASGMGPNAGAAVDTYKNLGSQLGSLFENYGAGQRSQINQAFDTTRNNALGSLAKRGFSGSSLAGSTASASERDRQLSLGAFEDKLLGQKIGAAQGVTAGIAGAQLTGADLNQQLIRSLLGLTESSSSAGQPGGGGGGGGGTGGSSNWDDQVLNQMPDYYGDQIKKLLGGGGTTSGGGGGGGGGGQTPSPSQPAFMENPYGKKPEGPTGGKVPDWAKDPSSKGGFSSTGKPGQPGDSYQSGNLTCVCTKGGDNYAYWSCVPNDQAQDGPPEGPPATGGIPGDLGDYSNMA